MAIKDKDGKIYTLRTPNPLMASQDAWDHSQIDLINMDYGQAQVFDLELPPMPTEENVVVLPPKKKIILPKTRCHCLPAYKEKKMDELYQTESYLTVFGEKFILEIIIAEETSLQILFYAEMKLNEGSIVYPQNESKRCWQITKLEPKPSGFLYLGRPSDISPDFSS